MEIYHVDVEQEPEFASYEDFVEELENDERDTFTHVELQKLSAATGMYYREILRQLVADGFRLVPRAIPRRVRTFSSNPHDRWYGPGSCKTHGGSGHEQIAGFAGRVG